ncbi:MAG: hypothetical protein HRU09_08585 [Oligoflexales bacterium]|nr:hypothetical protein [Oligoflexales bacterium]
MHFLIEFKAVPSSTTLDLYRTFGFQMASGLDSELVSTVTFQRKIKTDYILFSHKESFLELVNIHELSQEHLEPIPNHTHGSDHFPIVVNFKY